ncbi:Fis family transcriptional regulator [Flavobacterium akiainvivens]|uniref:Fis family transcriptional regulator n=1 Tax=Flavobacterium akiainvivens TaxID=1202724 RepID=A0A0M9VGU7_9FLAO|nr:sigma 54-interacting transcriptional regulator [Flavobacterium akiainvivens]KOS04846.1 Fis family transcriptional regulator [Flavobacterium akiainvivens]SFQ43353.1 Transcriptional regulator containing GAF, AAA-type ATPase, and DNA-binding Fis domains [Flavobacterium akiainvivens]
MKQKVLIVEDQFIEANDLEIMLLKAGYQVAGIANSVAEALKLIEKEKPGLVLVDIFLKGKETGIDLAGVLNEKAIPFIFISANSNHEVLMAAKATQPYGFIVKPFRERDLMVTLEIAQYRYENSAEANLRKEADLQKKLKSIADEKEGWEQKMLKTAIALQTYVPFDYMVAGFRTAGEIPYNAISFLRVGFNEYQVIGLPELQLITHTTLKELAALQAATPTETEPQLFNGDDFVKITIKPSMRRLVSEQFGMKSMLIFPLMAPNGETFYFFFYSRRPDTYKNEYIVLLRTFKNILVEAVARMLSIEKAPVQEQLPKKEPVPVKSPVSNVFSGIVGKSHLLLNVFDNIAQVAPADTSVLILGESGTGKERIAQCIHDLSKRAKQPLIKINCAALPANLIESELFGHEKGAFTGAVEKRTGKFELANKGTIFLDEIGEMPLELQSKLLRVLQEKEIERIGGGAAVKIDVRIIAATNRELEKEVAAGRFRLDLYYRLNIFPINLPPLRERREDIPLLADHFVGYFNRKIGKSINGLSKEALKEALAYNWPGNIRELENLMERAVLLAREDTIKELQLPRHSIAEAEGATPLGDSFKTIEDNEREHIMRALKKCNGKVWGAGGAAELLDLPPSTLNSRMKKLGIKRDFS